MHIRMLHLLYSVFYVGSQCPDSDFNFLHKSLTIFLQHHATFKTTKSFKFVYIRPKQPE